ncbi:amidohydrolase family protein [Natronococcus sp. A-GB1]|uniref:amidohydrolase family protein n=1 Tax=Natronococcus sp. A-GB1 TaxID=3037648 RepID=UPI00241F7048|nr:amidohydrolase family protein [Natronococcus sp. A-GB1]MDG5760357.1 amidohydrolase family protein [Natronococcus sp. A-GB1]
MVIDIHTHVGGPSDSESGTLFDPRSLAVDYDLRERIMDRNRIDRAVILPSFEYDTTAGAEATRALNESLRRTAEAYDRLICPVGVVEPAHGHAALDEIDRLAAEGFTGVTVHNAHQRIPLDAAPTIAVLERAEKAGLVPFIHCFSPDWEFEHLDRLASVADHLSQPVVVLDALSRFGQERRIAELGARFEHLYFDTTMVNSLGLMIESLVEELGARRLVFGSGLYTRPLQYRHSADLFQVRKADISEADRELILEGNARRILDVSETITDS